MRRIDADAVVAALDYGALIERLREAINAELDAMGLGWS